MASRCDERLRRVQHGKLGSVVRFERIDAHGRAGTWLAIIGVGGAIGVFGSGVIADSQGRQALVHVGSGLPRVISIPLQISTFGLMTPTALMCMVILSVLSNAYLGATIACVHGMVGLKIVRSRRPLLFFI